MKQIIVALKELDGRYEVWLGDRVWGAPKKSGPDVGWWPFAECVPDPLLQAQVSAFFDDQDFDFAFSIFFIGFFRFCGNANARSSNKECAGRGARGV